ncbi:Zeta-carotene desaturase/chromoplastic [Arachis hypogaea]|nr:Zeta-carotene desaturase/chromoplastic [Arachis hypogaea]
MDNEVLVLMLLWFWFTVNDAVIFNGAPKGLFPSEPKYYRGPKLKVAIIGAGLAGMSTAVELLDQGHKVDIYESRTFIGGKVGSVVDKKGNQIEMGLHVIFGCYNNLFRLMKNVGTSLFQFIKGSWASKRSGEIAQDSNYTKVLSGKVIYCIISFVYFLSAVDCLVNNDGLVWVINILLAVKFKLFGVKIGNATLLGMNTDTIVKAKSFLDGDEAQHEKDVFEKNLALQNIF